MVSTLVHGDTPAAAFTGAYDADPSPDPTRSTRSIRTRKTRWRRMHGPTRRHQTPTGSGSSRLSKIYLACVDADASIEPGGARAQDVEMACDSDDFVNDDAGGRHDRRGRPKEVSRDS